MSFWRPEESSSSFLVPTLLSSAASGESNEDVLINTSSSAAGRKRTASASFLVSLHLALFSLLASSCSACRLKVVSLRQPSGLLLTNPSPSGRVFCMLQQNALSLRPHHRGVFMIPNLLPREACTDLISKAEQYAQENEGWTSQRHTAYPTTDLPVDAVYREGRFSSIHGFVNAQILPLLASSFALDEECLRIGELFVAKYEYKEGKQAGLAAHKDGTQWSFVIGLNDSAEFEGGGTQFLELPSSRDRVHHPAVEGLLCRAPAGEVGTATLFSGKNLHQGVSVTKGLRFILAGFIDYTNPAWYGAFDARYDGSAFESVATGDELVGVIADYDAIDPDSSMGAGKFMSVAGLEPEKIRGLIRESSASGQTRLVVRSLASVQTDARPETEEARDEQRRAAERSWHALSVGAYFCAD